MLPVEKHVTLFLNLRGEIGGYIMTGREGWDLWKTREL